MLNFLGDFHFFFKNILASSKVALVQRFPNFLWPRPGTRIKNFCRDLGELFCGPVPGRDPHIGKHCFSAILMVKKKLFE